MTIFHIATEGEIKEGKITDVYFQRTAEILKAKGIKKDVKMEVRVRKLPEPWEWGVLAGVEEVAHLLEGLKVKVLSMEEGTVFHGEEPVLTIEGNYVDFAIYETALLGLLCQASGIATTAARCKKAAGNRLVISFGARRMHPALAPMIERNAFIGGCDGVAVVKSAELIAEEPVGTIPHALVLVLGGVVEAIKFFHEVMPPNVRRVALVDTFSDEKIESLKAAEALGPNLFGVRLDTPRSRRGDMKTILEEVRWELDLRGYKQVKLFVSGGLDEYEITRLNPVADAYGVGTYISNARVVDFAMDIVEIEGLPIAKKGKKSGAKQVLRCSQCFNYLVVPEKQLIETCACGGKYESLLKPLIEDGKIVRSLPPPRKVRDYVLEQLARLELKL